MRVSNPDAIPDCQRKSQARFCNARKRSPKRDRCAVVSFSMNASRWGSSGHSGKRISDARCGFGGYRKIPNLRYFRVCEKAKSLDSAE